MMELPKWFWILLILLLLEGCSKGCLENERIALLQLKSFFYDPNSLSNWVDVKGSDCCQWERVECSISSSRVIGLSLNYTRPDRGQRGLWYLNASLFLPFEELKSLYLNYNQITGCVDNGGFAKLSSALGKLEILDLSYNYFNDSILSSLSELSSLKSIYLAGNGFEGSNHTNAGFKWLSEFSNLETLDLSQNQLKNNFLLHVGGLASLKTLNLQGNQLKGSVDIKELNSLTNLRSLNLSNNEIESFQYVQGSRRPQMMNIEVLDLSGNLFQNNTFASISGLSNLKSLKISFNRLQGSIDIKELNNLAKLQKLDLSGNQIESLQSFQDSERQLKLINLEELDLSYNLFNNTILTLLSGLWNLKSLNLRRNQLKGSINIKELEALNDLEELDFSYNQLHELVAPKEIGSLRKLRVVELYRAFVHGTVSLLQVVEAFPSVKTLYLRDNYLNKTISSEEALHVSSNVEELFLDYSYLSENILQSIGGLTSLKTLTLRNCELTGTLPTKGWCDLRNLEELDLSENALEGTFPSCLDNLTSLQFLDISNNHFEVPASFISFANLSHLKFFFIDQNNLMREPIFQSWVPTPNFQLQVFSMSNCTTKGLFKELPSFLNYQYDLRYLELSYNNFSGKIPSWLLENNTRLQQLFLKGNSFTGPLQLPKHTNVDMLEIDMSQNKIQGHIPMNICSTFPNLEVLFLSQNAFEGNIPHCLGGLKSLSTLDLSYNKFSGGILEELAKSISLETLRLSNNNLSGKIAPTIFNSNALRELYLDGNNFDGEIPLLDVSVADFIVLEDIDLSNNHLSGKLPRWIWNVSDLQILALSNNHFNGLIPFEFCNLEWLGFLDLSQNNLSGSLPSCFNPPNIEYVNLRRNRLSGPFPHALYNSSSLVNLDLGQNNFTGKIPSWIGTLSALSILILKANHFEGQIPSQLCQLDSLSIIDLSQNKLFGPIPSCLSNLTLEPKHEEFVWATNLYAYIISLQDFQVRERDPGHIYPYSRVEEQIEFMTKKGLYTYSGNILKYMSGIDLSCNKLTGQIPLELGNLSELHSLNLSHNNLTGFIPSTFSKLKQVESLDLSHNNLSGMIPIQLMELNFLAVFNVSYNNLSGSIPYQKAQFATFDESSYMRNPFLCGPPLHKNCTETDSTPTVPNSSDSEEESDLVDKYVFYVTFLVSYAIVLMGIAVVLYTNPYWRRAWFYFIEKCITACHFFIMDNLLELSIFRRNW